MLDVENGKLCYIIGTIYMDMPLKPNVLEDLAREVIVISSTRSGILELTPPVFIPAQIAFHRCTTSKTQILFSSTR